MSDDYKRIRKICSISEPQWNLLRDIVDGKTKSAAASYKPRQALENSRLIRVVYSGWSDRLEATEAGKELVASVRQSLAPAEAKK